MTDAIADHQLLKGTARSRILTQMQIVIDEF